MAASRYDKLLVTHGGALRRKYGSAGEATVRAALDALITSDAERGLSTRVLLVDNTSTMRSLRLPRVGDGDWAAAVRTVDRAAAKYLPAYVALVGATDVFPQARVRNPLYGLGEDTDPYVPSDLPYACDIPDSWASDSTTSLDPASLLAVTRVVGRIPDLVGATDPALLLMNLATATSYSQHEASTYQRVFALTASVWKGSTMMSVGLLPGRAPRTKLSPPAETGWPKSSLAPLSHFVNCHGGDTTPDWFGQLSTAAPVDTVALAPEDVANRIAPGTVVVAECCYGAMHQDPADIGGRTPMMWAYLESGGYAGVGSSTTAYGPADGNGQADLVCRYALEGIMTGSSTGRALLDARQRYVREAGAMGPEDLKTLAQFDLLGDPSLQPVAVPGRPAAPKLLAKAVVPPGQIAGLAQRRAVLRASGQALAASVPRSSSTRVRTTGLSAAVLAREAGLPESAVAGAVASFAEHRSAPRAGFRFHVAPVRSQGRVGLLVSRETRGQRATRAIWRKNS
jgi:hypothetical protein